MPAQDIRLLQSAGKPVEGGEVCPFGADAYAKVTGVPDRREMHDEGKTTVGNPSGTRQSRTQLYGS